MLKGHTAVGRFDIFIGEAKAESDARIKAREEEQTIQREEDDARHLREQRLFELHILPIIKDADNSCRTHGIYSTLKTRLDARGNGENKRIDFELHDKQLNDSEGGELFNSLSDKLDIELVNDEVIFRIGHVNGSDYNERSLDKSSMDDVNSIEILAEQSIKKIIKRYFKSKEGHE